MAHYADVSARLAVYPEQHVPPVYLKYVEAVHGSLAFSAGDSRPHGRSLFYLSYKLGGSGTKFLFADILMEPHHANILLVQPLQCRHNLGGIVQADWQNSRDRG